MSMRSGNIAFDIVFIASCFVLLNMAAKPSHSDKSLKVKYKEID